MNNPERSTEPVDIDAVIGKYAAAWSEPDPALRKTLLEAVWSSEGSYTDPLSHAANRAELDSLISQFLKGNPGAKFTVKGKVDCHHRHIRFYWTVHLVGDRELSGMDYGEMAA